MPNYTQAVSPSHRGVELPQPPPSAMATPGHAPISSSQPPESTPQNREMPSSQGSENGSQAMSHSFSSSVGYLANRWNLGSSYSTPSGPVPDNNGPPRYVLYLNTPLCLLPALTISDLALYRRLQLQTQRTTLLSASRSLNLSLRCGCLCHLRVRPKWYETRHHPHHRKCCLSCRGSAA